MRRAHRAGTGRRPRRPSTGTAPAQPEPPPFRNESGGVGALTSQEPTVAVDGTTIAVGGRISNPEGSIMLTTRSALHLAAATSGALAAAICMAVCQIVALV